LDRDPTGGMRSGRVVLWSVATVLVLTNVTFRRRWPVPLLAVCELATTVHVVQATPVHDHRSC
jgi:hypothetical protein